MRWPLLRRILVEVLMSGMAVALLGWAAMADQAWIDRHFLPEFRASRSELLATIAVLRAAAAGLGLALLLWARPRLGRLAEHRTIVALASAAAPTAVAVVLSFGAAEIVLRVAAQASHAHKAANKEPLRIRDEEIGWVALPGHTGDAEAGGRRVRYAFDPQGFRVVAKGEPVDMRRPSILFAGESVMMGEGLPWPETVPAQVQAMTGIQAADIAFSGYSSEQAYMRLRREFGGFHHPVAVVTLLLPSAIYRSLERDRPHLDPDLRWRAQPGEWRLAHIARRQAPYRSDAEIERAVQVTRAVLRATARMAQARGATALIVTPILEPESPQEAAIRRRVLDAAGIRYLSVPIPAGWRIPGDQHPDARGARALAVAITVALKTLPPAGSPDGGASVGRAIGGLTARH